MSGFPYLTYFRENQEEDYKFTPHMFIKDEFSFISFLHVSLDCVSQNYVIIVIAVH